MENETDWSSKSILQQNLGKVRFNHLRRWNGGIYKNAGNSQLENNGKWIGHHDCLFVLKLHPKRYRVRLLVLAPQVEYGRLVWRYRLALKRELPKTSCSKCGAAGYNATVANGRCNKIIGGERCNGINQSATDIADWEECAPCGATGFDRNKICSLCRGVGFLLTGKI
jgi:hypothetical protein